MKRNSGVVCLCFGSDSGTNVSFYMGLDLRFHWRSVCLWLGRDLNLVCLETPDTKLGRDFKLSGPNSTLAHLYLRILYDICISDFPGSLGTLDLTWDLMEFVCMSSNKKMTLDFQLYSKSWLEAWLEPWTLTWELSVFTCYPTLKLPVLSAWVTSIRLPLLLGWRLVSLHLGLGIRLVWLRTCLDTCPSLLRTFL